MMLNKCHTLTPVSLKEGKKGRNFGRERLGGVSIL